MEPESPPATPSPTPSTQPTPPFVPVHLVYDLSRRQRLASHLTAWVRSWPGLLILVAAPIAGTILLAWRVSPWFWLLFLVGLPPMSYVHRFAGGLVNCLLYRRVPMDLVIEDERMGYVVGTGRRWLELRDVAAVERFGAGTWCVLFPDGTGIDLPVELVDDRLLEHLRRRRAPRPAGGPATAAS